jgi:arylsulfatase
MTSLGHGLGLLGFLSLLATSFAQAAAAPPDIILVTADALRADHLSINGYPRATSPTMDGFARSAWHFTEALSVIPKTGPSFATLFTGQPPSVHGVGSNRRRIPEALPVLAERLRTAGYRTAAFVGNPVLDPTKGFARGFDVYRLPSGGDGVTEVNQAFFAWAEEGPWRTPSFAWLHYIDPHGPYRPPPHLEALFLDDHLARSDERAPLEYEPIDGRDPAKILGAIPKYQQHGREDRVARYVARYDAEIRHVDTAFAGVLDFLRRRQRHDSSVIVFTADHGESLGERRYYFEHGWFADDAGLRVPLMIKTAGQRDGRVTDAQVSHLDLLPTLLDLAGVTDGGPATRGTNLLGGIAGRPPLQVENADAYPEKYRGVRTRTWKYLVRDGDAAEQLYDLARDPQEAHDVAGSQPEALERLRRAFQDGRPAGGPASPPRPDGGEAGAPPPELIDRLRSLGYAE